MSSCVYFGVRKGSGEWRGFDEWRETLYLDKGGGRVYWNRSCRSRAYGLRGVTIGNQARNEMRRKSRIELMLETRVDS